MSDMKRWGNQDFKEAVDKKISSSGEQALVEALRAIAIAIVYLAEQVRFKK